MAPSVSTRGSPAPQEAGIPIRSNSVGKRVGSKGSAIAPNGNIYPASTNYVLSLSADRLDATYKQGETVTFTITLLLDHQPVKDAAVNWTLSKDGAPPATSGTAKFTGASATITGKLDEPGFLQCRASFAGPDKLVRIALGGAAIDPRQIKASLPAPADFDEFWTVQKQKLAAIPLNASLKAEKSPVPGVECFDVSADCDGAPLRGYLARPTGAKPKSLPTILLVHGAGVRSSNLGGSADWARQGFLAMDMNAHGLPNGQPDEFYQNLTNGRLKNYSQQGRESREAVYFRGMFLRLVRAIDFLTAQPEWDGRTVVVHGSSQGGWQAIAAAGLDSRVTFFAAGVPAGCDHTGVVANRVNGWPQFLAKPPAKPDSKILEAVRYYDAVNFATRIKAAGIVTVGFIDTTCPPTSVYAAYNALPGKKEIFNDVPSGHALSPKAASAMREAIAAVK
ncbi:MAG: acetylxylan esterase [Verrucomicrobiota bacterium]